VVKFITIKYKKLRPFCKMDGVFYRIYVCNKFDDVDDYNNLENPLLIELLKK